MSDGQQLFLKCNNKLDDAVTYKRWDVLPTDGQALAAPLPPQPSHTAPPSSQVMHPAKAMLPEQPTSVIGRLQEAFHWQRQAMQARRHTDSWLAQDLGLYKKGYSYDTRGKGLDFFFI